MASLDLEYLFTNIPLEETINISCDSLFRNEGKINNFNRNDFEKLFRMALQNNFFNFDGKICKQTDGVAMGSPISPSLANAFLCFHEQIWLNDFLKILNLCITEDMWMTYLLCFVNQTILKNLLII